MSSELSVNEQQGRRTTLAETTPPQELLISRQWQQSESYTNLRVDAVLHRHRHARHQMSCVVNSLLMNDRAVRVRLRQLGRS